MADELISGVRDYAWGDAKVFLPQGELIHLESVSFKEKAEIESNYGAGNDPVSYSRGKKSREGKLEISQKEYNLLLVAALLYGGSIVNLPPFPIVEKLSGDGLETVVYTLTECVFEEWEYSRKQGDKRIMIPLTFKIMGTITPVVIP